MNKRTILSAFGIGAVVSGMILCTLQAGQLNRSFDPMELFKGKSLNDTKIASGLKEALKIGINNTVKLLGKQDGYFLNELVKIAMPEKFQMADKALRAVGFSQQLDEFV
ncbi:DUF4197 family protein, partial [bacterium]|nr:DUF4197 family protein [bacterium]